MKKVILILLAVVAFSSVALATKYIQTDSLVYKTEQKVAFKNKLPVKFSDQEIDRLIAGDTISQRVEYEYAIGPKPMKRKVTYYYYYCLNHNKEVVYAHYSTPHPVMTITEGVNSKMIYAAAFLFFISMLFGLYFASFRVDGPDKGRNYLLPAALILATLGFISYDSFSCALVVLVFSIVISLFSFLIAYSWYLKKLWIDYSLPLSELIGEDPQIIISESGDEGKPASHLVLSVGNLKSFRLRLVNVNYNYDKTKWKPGNLVQTLVFIKTLGRIPRLIIGQKLTYFLEDQVCFVRGREESVYIVLVAK